MMRKIILALFLFPAILAPLAVKALDTPDPGTTYSYPLPATAGSIVNVVYSSAESGSAQILAYNESGDLVVNYSNSTPSGLQVSKIDLCCLAPGVYVYLVLLHYDSGRTEKLKPGKFVVVR